MYSEEPIMLRKSNFPPEKEIIPLSQQVFKKGKTLPKSKILPLDVSVSKATGKNKPSPVVQPPLRQSPPSPRQQAEIEKTASSTKQMVETVKPAPQLSSSEEEVISSSEKKSINEIDWNSWNNEKNNPFKLLQSMFSRWGLLSSSNLENYLKKEKPCNERDIILWSFTQRKFLSQGSMSESKAYRPRKDQYGGWIDEKGYATETSYKGGENLFFITDEETIKIDRCVDYKGEGICRFGIYGDNRCIIKQPAFQSCVPTCIAMLVIDTRKESKNEIIDIDLIIRGGISKIEHYKNWCKNHGFEQIFFDFKNREDIIKGVNDNGPLLADIIHDAIGGHVIIVDTFDGENNTVMIRDPAHGWRITMDTDVFFKTMPVSELAGIKDMRKKI